MLTRLIAAELAVVLGLVAVACTDDDASSTIPPIRRAIRPGE